jgi:nitrogen fixation NifU-like protein
MSSLNKYSKILIDHYQHPRQKKESLRGTEHVHELNQLCGDHVDSWFDKEDGTPTNVHAQGSGCMSIRASASMLTEWAEGKSNEEILAHYDHVESAVKNGTEYDPENGDWTALAEVFKYPARENCALLPWKALKSVLEKSD